MKKDSKSNYDNTYSDLTIKVRKGYEVAKIYFYHEKIGHGKGFLEKLIKDIKKWSYKGSSFSLKDFYHEWGISSSTFHNYKDRHPELKEAFVLVKEIIGSRREKLAMFKKYECNEKTIHRTLHLYDPDWKKVSEEEEEFKLSLTKDEQNQKPTNITVVMKSYEDEDRDANKA